MMNRIDPGLFAACFTDWVRACWPEPLDAIAIDGKTVRRSHDRAKGRAALHLVSAFATNSRLVLGQEAVDDKTNETTAIPLLLEKLAAGRSLEGAVVTIDAIACNPHIAQSIRDAGADYLPAVKGNQPRAMARKTWRSCASSPTTSSKPRRLSATRRTFPSNPADGQPSRQDPRASSSEEK